MNSLLLDTTYYIPYKSVKIHTGKTHDIKDFEFLKNCDIHFMSQVLNRAVRAFILGYTIRTLAEIYISAIQANILEAVFFYINSRNQTKRASISNRHQIRFSDVGFLFSD